MTGVISNASMYIKPLVMEDGWGPDALYISLPLLWDKGSHPL